MQFLFDNLLATIVGGVVLLIMAIALVRSVEPRQQAFYYQKARTGMNDFVKVIRSDFSNIGARRGAGDEMLSAPQQHSAGERTESFSFYTVEGDGDDAEAVHLRYELSSVATDCAVSGEAATCYEVVRYRCEDPPTDCEVSGRSLPQLTRFHVQLLTQSGAPTSNSEEARGVRVRLETATPGGRASSPVPQLRWESSFFPANLSR